MEKAPYFFFFWFRVHVISLNLIAFIISQETQASLFARQNLYISHIGFCNAGSY